MELISYPAKGAYLAQSDCYDWLAAGGDNSIDAIVTDPPYELTSGRPGGRSAATEGAVYKGFMGLKWDGSGVAFDVNVWREALRVLKPGGHLLAFGGTRTYHRMACAIEDAGFEVRDSLHWFYGTGFPKSLNLGDGRGTALKPGHEPIVLARKPLAGTVAANVERYGTGALNVDACRIGTDGGGTSCGNRDTTGGRWPANVLFDEDAAGELDAQAGVRTSGAMKAGTNAGRKGLVYAPDEGRPLAEDIEASSGGASRFFYVAKPSRKERDLGCADLPGKTAGEATDRVEGSEGLESPRAGAGRTGGAKNYHPTVKPVTLMRYLVRLVTPPGGIVLDPFMGSGTTGMAAVMEGYQFIGIEKEHEYIEIASRRIKEAACLTTSSES